MLGKTYGRWTIIDTAARQRYACGRVAIAWLCKCECGTVRRVLDQSLRRGASTSCGCYHREVTRRNAKHGHAAGGLSSVEYTAWENMKARCFNPANSEFRNYGGRGITVCQRWAADFRNFLSDMGPRPDGQSLERLDVNGDYTPENCRWVPIADQLRNTRRNKRITHDGRTEVVAEWARELSLPERTLHGWIAKGRSIAQIEAMIASGAYRRVSRP
jgi:hypothetical protein